MEIVDPLVESDSSSDEETSYSFMDPLKDSFLSDFCDIMETADAITHSQSIQSMADGLTPRDMRGEERIDFETARQQSEQLKEYQERVHELVEEVGIACSLN